MKKIIVSMGIFAVITILSACANRKNVRPASAGNQTDEVATLKAKYTPDQLAQGQTIFNNNCGSCHEFHQPNEYSIREWNKIMPEMCAKSKLNTDDAGKVTAWVIVNTR